MPGKLGKYTLIETIGEGGMGTVYRGHDPVLDRTVAIKVLSSELAHEPSLVRRFDEEARALARVLHPNVIRIFTVGEEAGLRYYAMEFITGHTLAALIEERGPMPPADAWRIFRQVLDAAAAIHQAGVIHRDIKPGNVMVDADGRAVLMDFGLAKSQERASFTTVGAILGTPEYMAPEQAQGGEVDVRADIYALSSLLFEMLAGRRPFEGKDAISILRRKLGGVTPSVRAFRPDLPDDLDRVLARAMASDPARRHPDVAAFARDLAGVKALSAAAAADSGMDATAAVGPAQEKSAGVLEHYASRPPVMPATPPATRRRSRDWVTWALAGFGVLAGLAGLALLARGARSGDAPGADVPTPREAPSDGAARPGVEGLGDVVDLASGERVTATLLETFSRRDAADGQSKMYGRFRDSRGTIREWRLDDPPEVLRIRRSASAGKGGENP